MPAVPTPETLVADVRDLLSLPDVAIQINSMVDDPQYSAKDLGDVISRDPSLTARLLRIANSPFFGLSTKVATVGRAVTVVGAKPLRDLVIATCAIHSFKGIPNALVSMDDFWYHSLYCGLAARSIGQRRRLPHADTLFAAGLLHDIGQLIMFNRLPDLSREALQLSMQDPHAVDMHQAELEVFGYDHADVGGKLLQHWRLPAVLEECVARHHTPTEAHRYPVEVAIVHIANVLATMAEINSLNLEDVPVIHPDAWELAGVTDNIIEPVVRDIQKQFREARLLFLAEVA